MGRPATSTLKHSDPGLRRGGGYAYANCSCGWEIIVRYRMAGAYQHAQYLWSLHVGGNS